MADSERRMDLDRLHGPHIGRRSGKTYYTLTCALQSLDFGDTATVLCATFNEIHRLKHEVIRIAEMLEMKIVGGGQREVRFEGGKKLVFLVATESRDGLACATWEATDGRDPKRGANRG